MQCQVTIDGGRLTVSMAGTMTYADSAAFAEVFRQVRSARAEECTVDLGGLEHTDSSGLRMLLQVCDLCKDIGTYLTFRHAAGQVRERLLHCRFDMIVTIEGYSKLPRHHQFPSAASPAPPAVDEGAPLQSIHKKMGVFQPSFSVWSSPVSRPSKPLS